MARETFDPADLRYHLFRWSDRFVVESLDALEETWGISVDRDAFRYAWAAKYRARAAESAYPRLRRTEGVDLLGSDSLAFRTTTLRFDVREWVEVNMVDLAFARVARERAVPLVKIPRPSHWVTALDESQDDSIWMGGLPTTRGRPSSRRSSSRFPGRHYRDGRSGGSATAAPDVLNIVVDSRAS